MGIGRFGGFSESATVGSLPPPPQKKKEKFNVCFNPDVI